MSMPNIPDIYPDICLNYDDSINLVMHSIGLEEVSLSRLLDAETNKINKVLENCSCEDNILKINKSVGNILNKIINIQMLLGLKLETVESIKNSLKKDNCKHCNYHCYLCNEE